MRYEYCIVGGGIVGLATAREILKRKPGARLTVLEKEDNLALHQTGHNSGVIHAGIYYQPRSLKAGLCRAGAQAIKAFCDEHGIRYEVCGKILVATNNAEAERMNALFERAKTNGIDAEYLTARELSHYEPNIVGLGALLIRSTGIVDYRKVAIEMGNDIRSTGGDIQFGVNVESIQERSGEVIIDADSRSWRTEQLIVCAGLQSDRLARIAGCKIDHEIIPFRGEYFRLRSEKSRLIRHLIYPIPDPALPFLGIHLTRMIDGGITVGPNAVLGFAREGYSKFSFDLRDVSEFAAFPGFWKTMRKNIRSGLTELRNSLSKRWYLKECQKYCPSLEMEDLLPERAGIRAQAVLSDGTLVHDFLFVQTRRMLHVCNAPSPAATSSIPIGGMIADRLGLVRGEQLSTKAVFDSVSSVPMGANHPCQ